ncbi:hypothetical protein M9H77_18429 [Catharanthus roseus]|uniref:Uncharacterized protein n=1 Tax=Catharanthus roseus TaxID=4058 RepID=A0ACC0B7G2_CATRO|nr:hypothetical protein M9H77_18429 [Catharanthus roseus]
MRQFSSLGKRASNHLRREYSSKIKLRHPSLTEGDIQKMIGDKFAKWFRDELLEYDYNDSYMHLLQIHRPGNNDCSLQTLRNLSWGPSRFVKSISDFIVNSYRFNTEDRDSGKIHYPKIKTRVFDVPVVEVAFQEDIDIIETSLVDRRIEDIGPLAHEPAVSNVVDLIRGHDEDVEEVDHFINDKVEWESEDENNEEETEYESNDDFDS